MHKKKIATILGCLLSLNSVLAYADSGTSPYTRCLVIGDSIAQGTGAHTACTIAAEQGITSKLWTAKFGQSAKQSAGSYEMVLISLGSNDGKHLDSFRLEKLRNARETVIAAKRVAWIAPGPQFPARQAILDLARAFGDQVIERPVQHLQPDGVHFSKNGYKEIASNFFRVFPE